MTSSSISHSKRLLLPIFLLCFAIPRLAHATALPIDLDDLAARLAPEIDKAGVKSIAVVDFVAADEKPTELGWYLANKLSDSIIIKCPATLVVDRFQLQQLGVVSLPILMPDALKRVGASTHADTIVSGKIATTADGYLLTVALERVSDGSTITSIAHHLPHSRILDLLSPTGDHASTKPSRAGVMGVGVPECLYCPVPAETKRWRLNQGQNVILQVVISAAGTAEKINVVRSPGYLLSEHAAEAVSEWKFRPAPGEDGKPTVVVVPIEVDFKSSRT
jgi:TonB family protein